MYINAFLNLLFSSSFVVTDIGGTSIINIFYDEMDK